MKKIATVLSICLLVCLLMTACGAPTLVGTWKGQIDVAAGLNQQMATDSENTYPDLEFENIYLPITMEFTKDGECTLSFEDADMQAMTARILEQLLPILEEQLKAMGITLDDLVALSGMSKEEFTENLVAELAKSMDLSQLRTTEKYKTEDGMLYIDEDLEDADAMPYTLEGDTLTIQAGDNEGMDFMFPLVLTRA